MRERSKCETCRYFDAFDDKEGMCRVNSPVMDKDGNGNWPKVFNYDWCGKHRPFFKTVKTPLGVYMKPVEKGEEGD